MPLFCTIEAFTAMAKALSDPHRVRALAALRGGELCVCQLIELFGLAPSTVSKHMTILKQAGLVASRKDSRWVYYRLIETNNESYVSRIIDYASDCVARDARIKADARALAAIKNPVCAND